MLIVVIVIVVCFPVYLFSVNGPWLVDIMSAHPAIALGLPLAASMAICLVVLLESSEGPIEFEGLGFKFRGASGPIILWVLSFLAIVCAIRLLWSPS